MNRFSRRDALAAFAAAAGVGSLSAAPLAAGDQAPDFSLPSSKGNTETLSAYRGKKNVVVAFYPKAFTGG